MADGDDRAFDALVERYQSRAYRLAWSILRDAEEARDLSQEAFIRVYQAAGSFRREARFSTWFYRILVNLCLDHQRRHRWWRRLLGGREDGQDPAQAAAERVAAPATDPIDAVSKEQALGRLWAAVDRLSPRQRAAVLLQVQEGFSTAEIATVLRCSEATVRVHLHRAVAALRKTVGKA